MHPPGLTLIRISCAASAVAEQVIAGLDGPLSLRGVCVCVSRTAFDLDSLLGQPLRARLTEKTPAVILEPSRFPVLPLGSRQC